MKNHVTSLPAMPWSAVLLSVAMSVLCSARINAQSTTLPGTLSGTTVSINATSGTATVLGASTLSGTVSFNLQFGVEYLVAGGGGGGGGAAGGGGGAGGVRTNLGTPLVLGSQSYQTVVGAGGLGGNNANGTAGGSSSFSTVTASGGGLGGGGITNTASNRAGGSGGSGGGGGGSGTDGSGAASGGTGNAGAYTPAEGFGGGTSGNSPASNTRAGGGGGGAGGSGTNASGNTGGNGGIGLLTTIRGTSEYFGGGGGGGTRASTYSGGTTNVTGTGGLGGGGNGAGAVAGSVNGVAATANTGGGGGGGSYGTTSGSSVGGNGGSGIVIVRYLGSQWASGGAVVAGTGSAAGYTIHTFTSTGTSTFAVPTLSGRLAATVSDNLSGSGVVQFTGPGTLRLSGSNSYSGGTTITGTGSIVSFANTAARPAVGTTTVAAGSGIGLGVGGAGFFSASDIDSLFAGTFAGVSNDAASLVGIDTTAGNFTYSSNVAGTRGLAKLGSNTLTLSGSNSYTGGTQINAGVLSFANNALGSSGTVTVGGGTLQWGSGNTQDISSRLAIGAATLDTNGNNVTLATTFGGSAGGLLTKIGAGTLTLSASNSYIGDTTISAGTLAAGNAGAFGAQSGGLFAQGGVLDLGNFQVVRTGVVSFAGGTVQSGTLSNSGAYDGQSGSVSAALAGTAGLTKTTSGTLTLSASNSYSGGTTLNAGALNYGNVSAFGTGTLAFTGNTTLQAGVTGTVTNAISINSGIAGSFDTQANNATLSGAISGAGNLTKIGAGTLTLSASNSYTGGTTLNAGVLSFANNGLGTSGTVTLNSGTLQWASGNTQDISGRLALVSGSNATLDTNGNNVTLATGVGGSTSAILTKVGAGTLTLSASNSYTGGTQLNAGVLSFATNGLGTSGNVTLNSGTLQWATGNTQDISARLRLVSGSTATLDTNGNNVTLATGIGSSTNSAVVKVGSGTMTLSAVNTFTGGLTVNAGEIVLSKGGQPGVNNGMVNNAANTLTINNGGVVTMTASDVYGWLGAGGGPQILSPVVINAGGLLRNSGSVVNAIGPLTLAGGTLQAVGLSQQWAFGFSTGTVTVNGGANTSTITGPGIGLGMNSTTATVPTITFDVFDGAAATDLQVSGTLIDGVGGWPNSKTSSLTKAGAGTMVLSASNTYTGTTTVSAGTLTAASAGAFGAQSGNLVAQGGVLDLGNFEIVRTGTISFTGGTVQSGTLNNSTVAYDAQSGTVSAALAGSAGLTKTTTGTLTLSAANSYSGGTTLNAGVLSFANNGLGTSGTVTLRGGTLQWASGNTQDISSRLALVSGSTATLDTNGNGVTLATGFGSSTNAAITKIGAGTLTLSASNSYTGATTLNAGGLQLANRDAVANSTVTLSGTGSLRFDSSVAANAFTFGGLATSNTAATLALSNTAGTAIALTVGGNNAATTFAGSLSGSGSLVKVGSGVLTLSGTNTFTGGLTVNAGEVVLSRGGQPGINNGLANNASNALTINSGAVVTMTASDVFGWLGTAGPQILSPVVINAGGLLRNSGNVVNALGPVTLAGGTLQATAATTQGWAFGFSTGTVTVNGGANTSTIAGPGIGLGMNNSSFAIPSVTFDVADGTAAIDLHVSGTLIDGVSTWPTSKVSSLIKAGAGLMQLSAANTFTGSTSIASGILDITSGSAVQNTSGVFIANAARLRYSGGTGSVDRAISVTSGTGTVENTGGGTLTLSGALSKNGTVLRLSGGSFNVTGLITGTSTNSDLVVSGTSTVTLSNTNTYNGPTVVNQSSTLILGTNSAIPNNSLVTLGDATTTGTLNMNGFTDSIGGLSFGAAGGTLRLAATSTSTAPLTAPAGTMTLTNGTLDLAGSGSTAGLYRVLSAQTVSGSLASITGTSAAYQVVTTSSSVNYQQRAVLGAVSVTNPAVSIITGGSAAFTYTVANTALSGGADLGFSSGSLSPNLAGTSSGTAAAGGSSQAISGLLFTGTSIGTNQQGTFTVTAPTAFGATTATGTVAVTVLDHALPGFQATGITDPYSQTTLNINFGSIDESAGMQSFTYSLLNLASQTYGAGLTAGLDFTGVTANGNGFASGLSTFSNLVGGGTSSLFTMTFTPSGQGTFNKTFTLSFSDNQALSGASARRDLTINAQVIVVPEPGAIALAGIGIAAAAWALRRKEGSFRSSCSKP